MNLSKTFDEPDTLPPFAVSLESEGGLENIDPADLSIRQALAASMLEWPIEAFSRMRHLEPQIGCLNRCSFCSQSAGTTVWYLDKRQLANVMAALKYVAIRRALDWNAEGSSYLKESSLSDVFGKDRCFASTFEMPSFGLLGYERKEHRPGVLFCYLDNDICMYPHLDLFLMYVQQDLGVTIRISSVGYSRRNKYLQEMHENIARNLSSTLAGVRLSLSSYSIGWKNTKATSQDDFILDMSNFLRTYEPAFKNLGLGGRTACVEFRFRPLLHCSDLIETFESGHHIISCGPYLLISEGVDLSLPSSKIVQHVKGRVDFDQAPTPYYLTFQNLSAAHHIKDFIKAIRSREILESMSLRRVPLYKMAHPDGYYYAVSQTPTERGYIYAKQFYPSSPSRIQSGYIDSERYFLNALLAIKSKYATFSWAKVDEVLDAIEQKMSSLEQFDPLASVYIKNEILPLVIGYRRSLELAGFSPSLFFDKEFTRDTGTICNLGRAYAEFRPFASRPNLPLTPAHERAYGLRSSLASEGLVWRLAVAPFSLNTKVPTSQHGARNSLTESPKLMLEELDLRATSTESGQSTRRFWLPINEIQSLPLSVLKEQFLVPGQCEERTK